MNIFIIGPEGAGKTVFATMLNQYIGEQPEHGLRFMANDLKTKKYIANELALLNSGEWPASTRGGEMVTLNWKWQFGKSHSDITMIDPAGQDIRNELCGKSTALNIVENIRQADLLILLVDLYGHQDDNNDKRIENAWIVEHTLLEISEHQSLIFAVTKADMLTGSIPIPKWNDRQHVLDLVKEMMPEFNFSAYEPKLSRDNCCVLAFSSVTRTGNIPQEDGSLLRFPKAPLASEGMDFFVHAIKRAWRSTHDRNVRKTKMNFLRLHFRVAIVAASIFVVLFVLYLGYWYLVSC
jgi:hypothetical protein